MMMDYSSSSSSSSSERRREYRAQLRDILHQGELVNYCNNEQVTDVDLDEKLKSIQEAVISDDDFKAKYITKSMFVIGSGAFGCVLRFVTCVAGMDKKQNTIYPIELVKYLQLINSTHGLTKDELLDGNRSVNCLDLVAVKFESVKHDEVDTKGIDQINLVREFSLILSMFKNADSRFSMVGFPMPIDFNFVGNESITSDEIESLVIFNESGCQQKYIDAYIQNHALFSFKKSDVRCTSYMAMELIGPNLDEWKKVYDDKKSTFCFSVQTTFKLMDQVLCRLLVMHRNNIVHLDLKPDNICMGVENMSNTVYLLDFGLSRRCSANHLPNFLGTRRYMSVGVHDMQLLNYMMDIESWFYVLITLLTDYSPWSDREVKIKLGKDENAAVDEQDMYTAAADLKKTFWNDNHSNNHKKMLNDVLRRIEHLHKDDVPDIKEIMQDLYNHILSMREQFIHEPHTKMCTDIANEDSDLFKRYKDIRKLLLFIYDCKFTDKLSCFVHDRDLHVKQLKRKNKGLKELLYVDEKGRDWKWDWDEWFKDEQKMEEKEKAKKQEQEEKKEEKDV